MSAQEVITAHEIAVAENKRTSLIEKFAHRYGLEPNRMMATLKATAFKGDVTNEQMAALLIVADQHGLNPWLREIYAFPSRQGIVPVVGVDGWARIINEHPNFDGMEFVQDDDKCTCTIYRKDRSHAISVTEYHSECVRKTDPWLSHPKRMLRHKAMIQCARIAFAFVGIFDPDEAERIVAAEDAIDVTPDDEGKSKKISPRRMRKIVDGLLAAVKAEDGPGLLEIWTELDSEEQLQVWGELRSWERSGIKALREKAEAVDGGGVLSWALEAIAQAKDQKALETVWNAVQAAYDENGHEVPLDVNTVYQDRKNELAQ